MILILLLVFFFIVFKLFFGRSGVLGYGLKAAITYFFAQKFVQSTEFAAMPSMKKVRNWRNSPGINGIGGREFIETPHGIFYYDGTIYRHVSESPNV
ncbi:MAG TPA: hypothetical protein VN963_04340 [bacterium]|nr:hypothetical protein [bacterium]